MLEESFEQLDQEQCAAYLKRLKLPQEECTLEFLDRLIRRHLEEIPFENLDLVRTHELISTDLDTVYKKIIQGKRGGYCFELNALFLVRVVIQHFSKNTVISMVLGHPNSEITCIPPS